MRKILMASVATLAATVAMSGGAKAQPAKPVAPGTVAVHVNGYLQFEVAGYSSTDNTVTGTFGPSTGTSTGVGKLNPISTDGDARLYFGFDAATLSGIAYGTQIELRTQASDAGVGAGKVSGDADSTSTIIGGSEGIYLKRAYGYIGSASAGFIRLGQGDSAFSLLQDGAIESFGDGAQFNTDGGESALLPTDATPGNFIYSDASGLYATGKVVYLTPSIAGFSGGFGYEPNSNGLKEGYNSNAGASSTSAALSSSPSAADIGKRRKNTIDAAVQYAETSNGVAVKASTGILYGAPIDYDGAFVATSTSALHHGYDNLEVYQAGAQATFAGVTVGANVKGGQTLDSYAFKVKGTRDAFAYIVGATYVIGPYVLGASYYNEQTAGNDVPGLVEARTLSEYGFATGANYVISPNLSLFAQYEYGHKHQPGNATLDISTTSAATKAKGDAQVQAIATGATFK